MVNNFSDKANFIWSIANLLRDAFKRSKYQDVILPLTVRRRIDCVLEPTKDQVLETYHKLKGRLDNLAPQLSKASGFAFYNTSPFTFEQLLQDAPNLAANLNAYINGFSDNMREVLEKFDFPSTIARLDEKGLLFLVMEKFKSIDLHPDQVANLEMGYIFEELVRRFNEALNENPGEHFTPRELIRLMINVLLSQDQEVLSQNHIVRTVYDPCCGSGGMLTIAKERIQEINPKADVHLFGQEVNDETFAVCKSDLYMKSADGRDAENIKYGSTLANDQHARQRFDYLLTNPPFGKEWRMDENAVRLETERGYAGRFGPGLPRISDGQLLFLLHMLARMKDPKEGGGRIGIVMNGSPLFTGDAGSGESEIRRWVFEQDYLEAIIALPEKDETAAICRDAGGHPEPDPDLRDTENVPLGEDIDAYFDREVRPHVPDAWINPTIRDHKDGDIGKVGYEINFNRYFYTYQPPRPLEEIEADIRKIEQEITVMLGQMAARPESP